MQTRQYVFTAWSVFVLGGVWGLGVLALADACEALSRVWCFLFHVSR